MCLALMVDPQGDAEIIAAQDAIRKKLDDWIPKILSAQEPDGYLQTFYTLNGLRRWTNKGDHEGYTAGYFIEAAIAHYLMTGKSRRPHVPGGPAAGRLLVRQHRPGRRRSRGTTATRNWNRPWSAWRRWSMPKKGPARADKYIESGQVPPAIAAATASEYDQSHLPVTRQYEAVGHAVRAAYLLLGHGRRGHGDRRRRLSQRRCYSHLGEHRQQALLRDRRHRQRRDFRRFRAQLLAAQQRLLRVVRQLRRVVLPAQDER